MNNKTYLSEDYIFKLKSKIDQKIDKQLNKNEKKLKKGYENVVNAEKLDNIIAMSKELKNIRREIVKGLDRLKKDMRKNRTDLFVKVKKQREFVDLLSLDSILLHVFKEIRWYPSERMESPEYGCSCIKSVNLQGDAKLFSSGQNAEISLEFVLNGKKYEIHSNRYSDTGRMKLYNAEGKKIFELDDRYWPSLDDDKFGYGDLYSWIPEKINSFIAGEWILDFVELDIRLFT